ncbi:MAG: dihydropteroate synthase [Bacteroidales bacterium]|nr:dihydropteroate synthase [Bacteroidales bacterium]MCF8387713.1 dihydropteroate synthase [Bacteroidales bacterium]MCF8398503.1 dihydropteroate synthase [Bacteroidales bacterium]
MTRKGTSFSEKQLLECGGKKLDLSTPAVMGVLNITPDSFYDGGKNTDFKTIENSLEEMIREGASIIDIGGTSTRPGAPEVSKKLEWERIEPVLRFVLKTYPEMIVSIDTYRSQVAEKAMEAGVHIINDISGGTFDEQMIPLISQSNCAFVIMHIQGTPRNMQKNPAYSNVTKEIGNFFQQQINQFKKHGFDNLILDPGFGFGKTVEHNFSLLKNLGIYREFDFPLLAGLSRKSMINKILGTQPASALNGTTTVNTIALLNGANILRVHDVKEAVEAVKIVEKLKKVD